MFGHTEYSLIEFGGVKEALRTRMICIVACLVGLILCIALQMTWFNTFYEVVDYGNLSLYDLSIMFVNVFMVVGVGVATIVTTHQSVLLNIFIETYGKAYSIE